MVWRGGPMPPHYRIFEPSMAWSYNYIAFDYIAWRRVREQAFYREQRLAMERAETLIVSS
jgi:hypothetical protein